MKWEKRYEELNARKKKRKRKKCNTMKKGNAAKCKAEKNENK